MKPLRRTLLVLLPTLLLAATGCTSAVQAQQTSDAAATPVAGGTLRLGITSDLTPARLYSGADAESVVTGLVYDTLIEYQPESLEPQPRLATSWVQSPDGRSITLTLRDDVTFHNDRPLTAADVAFSIQTYAEPARAGQLLSTAARFSTEVVDDHTLKLTAADPVGNVFDLLSVVPIIDKDSLAGLDTGEAYVGTGPFEFTDWIPNQGISFTSNEDYWAGAPYLDGVDLSVVRDSQTQVSQLRSGQLDAITGAAANELDSLTAAGFKHIPYSGAGFTSYLGVNVENPALADPAVRRAIASTIDRDRIISDVFRGHAQGGRLPWPSYSPAYDERDTPGPRDLEQARKEIGERTITDTIPLTYLAGADEATAQIIQANLAEIGITVELQPLDSAQFLKQLIGGEFPGLWLTSHTYAQYTPGTLVQSAYPFNARRNASHFISADYQKLADETSAIVDPTTPEAAETYRKVNDLLLEQSFVIEIGHWERRVVTSPSMHDVNWSKRSELDLRRAYVSG